jgi:hypothetical protein
VRDRCDGLGVAGARGGCAASGTPPGGAVPRGSHSVSVSRSHSVTSARTRPGDALDGAATGYMRSTLPGGGHAAASSTAAVTLTAPVTSRCDGHTHAASSVSPGGASAAGGVLPSQPRTNGSGAASLATSSRGCARALTPVVGVRGGCGGVPTLGDAARLLKGEAAALVAAVLPQPSSGSCTSATSTRSPALSPAALSALAASCTCAGAAALRAAGASTSAPSQCRQPATAAAMRGGCAAAQRRCRRSPATPSSHAPAGKSARHTGAWQPAAIVVLRRRRLLWCVTARRACAAAAASPACTQALDASRERGACFVLPGLRRRGRAPPHRMGWPTHQALLSWRRSTRRRLLGWLARSLLHHQPAALSTLSPAPAQLGSSAAGMHSYGWSLAEQHAYWQRCRPPGGMCTLLATLRARQHAPCRCSCSSPIV